MSATANPIYVSFFHYFFSEPHEEKMKPEVSQMSPNHRQPTKETATMKYHTNDPILLAALNATEDKQL